MYNNIVVKEKMVVGYCPGVYDRLHSGYRLPFARLLEAMRSSDRGCGIRFRRSVQAPSDADDGACMRKIRELDDPKLVVVAVAVDTPTSCARTA